MSERRTADTSRPLVLGYICEHILMDAADLATMTERLASFAHDEGYALGRVYVERLDRSPAAFQAMVDELARQDAPAVVVPGVRHLLAMGGSDVAVQHVRHCAGARVLVAASP